VVIKLSTAWASPLILRRTTTTTTVASTSVPHQSIRREPVVVVGHEPGECLIRLILLPTRSLSRNGESKPTSVALSLPVTVPPTSVVISGSHRYELPIFDLSQHVDFNDLVLASQLYGGVRLRNCFSQRLLKRLCAHESLEETHQRIKDHGKIIRKAQEGDSNYDPFRLTVGVDDGFGSKRST